MANAIKILTSFAFFWSTVSPTLSQAANAAKQSKPVVVNYSHLPKDVKTLVNHRLLQGIFYRYSQVKTSKDFENFFVGVLPEKDRKELAVYFPLKKLPAMSLKKGVMSLTLEDRTVTLEIVDAAEGKLLINGKVWNYSASISTMKNAENLHYFLLKKGNSHESALRLLLLPEAQAILPIILGALVAVFTASAIGAIGYVASTTGDVICQISQEKYETDLRKYAGICSGWFEKRDKAILDSGILQAGNAFRKAQEAKGRGENYELDVLACPAGPVKDGDIVLKNKIRRSAKNPESLPPVPLAKGNILDDPNGPQITGTIPAATAPAPDKETLRAWNQVVVKLKGNLDMSEIAFYPDGVDTKGAGSESNVIFKIVYNPDGSVSKVGLRNNLYKPGDGSSPIVWVDGVDARARINNKASATELEANMTSRLAKADEMANYILERAKECAFRTQSGAEKIPGLADKVIKVPAVAPVETTPAAAPAAAPATAK